LLVLLILVLALVVLGFFLGVFLGFFLGLFLLRIAVILELIALVTVIGPFVGMVCCNIGHVSGQIDNVDIILSFKVASIILTHMEKDVTLGSDNLSSLHIRHNVLVEQILIKGLDIHTLAELKGVGTIDFELVLFPIQTTGSGLLPMFLALVGNGLLEKGIGGGVATAEVAVAELDGFLGDGCAGGCGRGGGEGGG